jgi:hypothetical protein
VLMLGVGAVLDKTQEGMRGDRERLDGARCEVDKILRQHTNIVPDSVCHQNLW